MKARITVAICIMLIFLITGCSSQSNGVSEKNGISSEPQEASSEYEAADVEINDMDTSSQTEISDNTKAIIQTIMNSKFAGCIGKTEAEIEDEYGPAQSEGDWFNGLLYTKHENFSGSIGYGNAEPGTVTEKIESDSICNTIYFKLSELVPVSDVIFNKDELEFINDESEGDYYYVINGTDEPIHIVCDESGNIEQDPWIFVYLRT